MVESKTFCLAVLLFVFLISPGSSFAQQEQNEPKGKFLTHAIEVANWLETQRVDKGDETTWPSTPSQSKTVSYNLYNGTSGIVLFYLQLYRATGNTEYLNTAERGANGLLAHVEGLDENSDPGYWTGYTGMGATLSELFQENNAVKYRRGYQRCSKLLIERAQTVKNSKRNGVHFNNVTDVIAGSAGIGFALLYSDQIRDEGALALAIQVGDGLLDVGQPVLLEDITTGLKWMMTPDYPREMPNYSHGTAGICDFLLELDGRVIKKSKELNIDYDRRFGNSAVSGAKYLASIADLENDNCLIVHHRNAETNPEENTNPELYYLGWCHGPTGTGQLFDNLSKTFPEQRQWKQYSRSGANGLINSGIPGRRFPGFWNNVGICCGSSGIGSYAIDVYLDSADPRFKEFAIRLADDTLRRATQHDLSENTTGLSWQHAEHRVRPDFIHEQTGLMQGASGIGLWFLKLDAALHTRTFEFGIPLHPLRPIPKETGRSRRSLKQ